MYQRYFFIILFLIVPVFAFGDNFIAGKDYLVLQKKPAEQAANAPILVTEFFSYGCPWCNRLEPKLEKWVALKGKKISFNQIPVVFNQDWAYYAKAYYTLMACKKVPQLNPLLFKAILIDKRPLANNQKMIDFLSENGVDPALASSAFLHSPSIDLELQNGQQLMVDYRIAAVPAVVINKQYKTDLQLAKSEERFFAILNYLVKKASEGSASG